MSCANQILVSYFDSQMENLNVEIRKRIVYSKHVRLTSIPWQVTKITYLQFITGSIKSITIDKSSRKIHESCSFNRTSHFFSDLLLCLLVRIAIS